MFQEKLWLCSKKRSGHVPRNALVMFQGTLWSCSKKRCGHVPRNALVMFQETLWSCSKKRSGRVPRNALVMFQETLWSCSKKRSGRVPRNALVMFQETLWSYSVNYKKLANMPFIFETWEIAFNFVDYFKLKPHQTNKFKVAKRIFYANHIICWWCHLTGWCRLEMTSHKLPSLTKS